LQLIADARRICPDVIIELGEDISRFRDASKELYGFVKEYTWNGRVERLGFDEVCSTHTHEVRVDGCWFGWLTCVLGLDGRYGHG
jgi:hypothetical protein